MATSWLAPLWSHPIGARIAYYPSLFFGVLRTNSERHWYDRIDDVVILGALPFHNVAKKLISVEGVARVVTLNEEYETRFLCPTSKQWEQMGAKQLRIPTVDFNNAPNITQIKNSLEFIKNIEDGSSVYVHCKAGRSRSATVAACYLIQKYGMSINEAVNFLHAKRPHIVLGDIHLQRLETFAAEKEKYS